MGKGRGVKRGRRAFEINKRKWLLCEQSYTLMIFKSHARTVLVNPVEYYDIVSFLIYLYGYWINSLIGLYCLTKTNLGISYIVSSDVL